MFIVTQTSVRPLPTIPFFSATIVPAAADSMNAIIIAARVAGKSGILISTQEIRSGDNLTHIKNSSFVSEEAYNTYAATIAAAINDINAKRIAYNAARGITYTRTTSTV